MLVEDSVVISIQNVSTSLITLDRGSTTSDSVVVRWRWFMNCSFVSLSMVVEATEVSSQVQVAYLASVSILKL